MLDKLICPLIRLVSGASARWEGCAPLLRQRIYFANHTSHLDFVVIWALLPEACRPKTRPVAARDYWQKNQWRRYLAEKIFQAVLIDRGKVHRWEAPEHPINQMMEVLQKGFSMIVFPEGSRSLDGTLKPFKSGLFYLAQKCPHLECIPVYLENFNRILPKGEFLPVPLLGSVTFGAPLQLQKNEEKGVFLERARQAIEDLKG